MALGKGPTGPAHLFGFRTSRTHCIPDSMLIGFALCISVFINLAKHLPTLNAAVHRGDARNQRNQILAKLCQSIKQPTGFVLHPILTQK